MLEGIVSGDHQRRACEVLTIMCQLERVVKWLRDVREVRPEGKLRYDVREIHH